MQEAEIVTRRVVINGERSINIRYSDDTVLLTETEKELQKFETNNVAEVISVVMKGLKLEQVKN